MTTYEIKKKFSNYYLKRADEITFRYTAFDGFDTKKDAEMAVAQLGHSPNCYVYVIFKGKVYAVSMETQQKQVVVGKDNVYFQYKDEITRTTPGKLGTLPFTLTKPHVGSDWINACAKDLEEIQGKALNVVGGRLAENKKFARNSVNLLGMAFFDTMVPVYQLNAFDVYFAYPPSRLKLWEKGIKAYNPFSGKIEYTFDKPYTLHDFKVDHALT